MNKKELLVLAAKVTGKSNLIPYNEPFTYPTNTAEVGVMRAEIARLNHQHANDEAANQMLSEVCAKQRKNMNDIRSQTINECAALFSGGIRNREMYVNDVEEMILGLMTK